MTAVPKTVFSVVRFKVKPGMEQTFLDAHRDVASAWPGLRHANIVKTGAQQGYCLIAEWESQEALASARPRMIATLDRFRAALDDLGNGLGISDPVSGPVVLAIK